MGVNFNTVPGPVVGFALTCAHGMTSHRFEDYPAVRTFLDAEYQAHRGTGHLAECGDEFCAAMPVHSVALEADPSPSIRVSESHAAHLVRLLGYPVGDESVSGSDSAEGFLGRVRAAQATADSGYVEVRLEELHEIGEFSAARGRDVQWA